MSEHGSAQRPDAGGARRPDAGDRDELYGQLRAYEGQTAAPTAQGKDPVNAPMIRHWCEALGHPVPPDGTAPATMLQVWTMAGLAAPPGGADAGALDGEGVDAGEGAAVRERAGSARAGAYGALLEALESAGYSSVVATDCEQEYLRALRPGEAVSFDAVIESVSPRKTTKLGTGYFVTTRMDIRAGGETAGTHRFRILKYRPAHAGRNAARPGSTRPDTAGTGKVDEADKADKAGKADKVDKVERPALRPRPVVNRDNAPFWEGVSAHELLIQRCDACGTPRFPWLPGCNACGSPDWTPFASAGRGTVYSYVVMHHPPFPAFDPPYAVALVELEEGVRIVSNITGVPCEKVRIGMPVELEFLRVGDELELPVFRGTGAA